MNIPGHLTLQSDAVQIKLQAERERYSNQGWRLNNLYHIKNKQGKIVPFVMNEEQERLYYAQWFLNVILKARQLGFSTFIDILILDTCLFNSNIDAGIIAHHKDDAKSIFDDKVKLPYNYLPQWIKDWRVATTDRAGEIEFNNGSSIRVSTSFRSGTLQILHVSEYGKISAKYPDKAKEIKTGAFEAVAAGQKIFVESTAEGRGGEFFDLCEEARNNDKSSKHLTELDFKFHFFAWHENPEYRLNPLGVTLTQNDIKYFKDLRKRGIKLDDWQKAWWSKKRIRLQDDIYKEHPSYPEEAFKASVEGAYYGLTMTQMRVANRIGRVPWEPTFPVHTSWDLGMNDSMTIWFFQQIVREIRIIDYYQNQHRGIPHYASELKKKPYTYGNHYMPHDIRVQEMNDGERRIDVARKNGLTPIIEVARPKNNEELLDQIDMTRKFLAMAWIDEGNCDEGIKGLENYRKEWDDKLATFKKTPLHDWASHPADGLRTGAVGFKSVVIAANTELAPPETNDY